MGPLRPDENRELFYKKDMGILARGGFSLRFIKKSFRFRKKDLIN